METRIGYVTHYYNRIGVAVLSLTRELKINDTVHISGRITDFYQKVWSMEIEHHQVQSVGPQAEVALKVAGPVRKGDKIFLLEKVTPEESKDILIHQQTEWEGHL